MSVVVSSSTPSARDPEFVVTSSMNGNTVLPNGTATTIATSTSNTTSTTTNMNNIQQQQPESNHNLKPLPDNNNNSNNNNGETMIMDDFMDNPDRGDNAPQGDNNNNTHNGTSTSSSSSSSSSSSPSVAVPGTDPKATTDSNNSSSSSSNSNVMSSTTNPGNLNNNNNHEKESNDSSSASTETSSQGSSSLANNNNINSSVSSSSTTSNHNPPTGSILVSRSNSTPCSSSESAVLPTSVITSSSVLLSRSSSTGPTTSNNNPSNQVVNIKSEPESPQPGSQIGAATQHQLIPRNSVLTTNQQQQLSLAPPPPPPPRIHQSQSQQQQQQAQPNQQQQSQQQSQQQQQQLSGMPSMLTSSGPTANHASSQHHQSASPLTVSHHHNPHLMDYHHHHSPGGGGPLGLTVSHHGSPMGHPSQTILSMSSNNNNNPGQPTSMSANVSVVTVASSSPSSDPKECIEEQCPVCGDRVSGYHYGLLTCESCKGFFKRTVQNKKVYTCVAERNCHIDKSQRKRCPYCRFQKCLEVGMKLEAVRADRMRGGRNKFGPMYKRDRARRLQLIRQKQLTKVHHIGHHGGHHGGAHMGHLGPPGATMLPGGELNFLSSGHGGPHTTTIFDGVKQELIQIPQLSSSTSSPDSSPSPGSTGGPGSQGIPGGGGNPLSAAAAAAAAAAAVAAGGHGGQHQGGHGGQHHSNHSFMSQLSISAHPMTGNGSSGGNNNGSNSSNNNSNMNINPAQVDQLIKSWANGGGAAAAALLPGTSKTSMNAYLEGATSNNNTSSNASSNNGGSTAPGNKYMPPLIREFQSSMLDDKEWQAQLFGLLQNQTYNQCEVDLFELMCKVIDQSLFSQVDWARNSIFFKDLKVDDQMKLLQHAWSDMLVLDHIHQRMHVGLPDDTTLPNGQKFDLLSLALLGVPQCIDSMHRVAARLGDIKLDANDYICLKFLILLDPAVRGLTNYKLVQEAHEQTKQALLEYTINFYPQIGDKFQQLITLVPEIRALTVRGEDFLYYKHMNGLAPTQTLLMEMLHAKKK